MTDPLRCLSCGAELTAERAAGDWAVCESCEPPENWLDNQDITCKACGTQLGWVLHSPFASSHVLYCGFCPRRVEISVYDPVASALSDRYLADFDEVPTDETGKAELETALAALRSAIELRLDPCACGGTYSFSARPRCLECSTVIDRDPKNRDVWFADETGRSYEGLILEDPPWKGG